MKNWPATIVACIFLGCVVAAWAVVPRSEPIRDNAEVVEVNRFYDEQARLVFCQVIWYDASGVIIAWRLVRSDLMLPFRDRSRGDYVMTWIDGETWRTVRAKYRKETWTQYDPEVAQREAVPKECRRELTPADPYLKAEWRAAAAKWKGVGQ